MSPRQPITSIKISAILALVGGFVLPALETSRRWHQLGDLHYFINWFDDYLIGGFLLMAAIKTLCSPEKGQPYLIGAWGFATGMAFSSFFSQIQHLDALDPSGIGSVSIAAIKGLMLAICILFLFVTIRFRSANGELGFH